MVWSGEFKITDARSGSAFTVRVVTRAARTEIVGLHNDGALKVRLMSYPAGSPAANQELLDFLARTVEVDLDRMEIVAGADRREKLISVEGVSTTELETRLSSYLDLK